MKLTSIIIICISCFSLLTSEAHAEIQTWRYQGKVERLSLDYSPPDFARLGKSIIVDFSFDTSTSITYLNDDLGYPDFISVENPFKEITINDEKSSVSNSILQIGNVHHRYFGDFDNRIDEITSFRLWLFRQQKAREISASNLGEIFELYTNLSRSTIRRSRSRLNIDSNYIEIRGLDFRNITPVPEVNPYAMMSTGLILICLFSRQRAKPKLC